MQRWVGSAAGSGVLGLAPLLPPRAPGLMLQVKGKWRWQEGSAEQLSVREGKGRLSQFRAGAAVRDAAGGSGCGGAVDLPGSVWESVRSCPVPPSLPHPTGLLGHPSPPVSLSVPWEQAGAAAWGLPRWRGGAAPGSWQAPEPPWGWLKHQAALRVAPLGG